MRSDSRVTGPILLEHVRRLFDDAMRPANFFVRKGLRLEWSKEPEEDIAWEIFHGRLLDGTQTRERRAFESWQIHRVDEKGRSAEPLLSAKFDVAGSRLHVVRAIDSYAWEGYHAGDNVYLSRETRKWLRELVGTISLHDFDTPEQLLGELTRLLFEAIVGTSRLPLTSLEAPLPAYSFGELGYFYRPDARGDAARQGPISSFQELLSWSFHDGLDRLGQTKLLELLLRSTDASEVDTAARQFAERWRELGRSREDLQMLFLSVFNNVALSPWTSFVERMLQFLRALQAVEAIGPPDRVDVLAFVLRNLGRHLTAYDLVTFHHRGANYPDALLLDAALKELLGLADRYPSLFISSPGDACEQKQLRLRRRALRQGWLLRRIYQGLPVPEAPTSPGENARVMPMPRVPEEEILMPAKRTRRLFEDDALEQLSDNTCSILRESIRDLGHPAELRELGMAVFLDRPLGAFKAPGEPDRTVLLSYEAFSRSLAERRLRLLSDQTGLLDPADLERRFEGLQKLAVNGLPLPPNKQSTQPDTVSLEDARKAAADFIFLRTTRQTTADFLSSFDFREFAAQFALEDLLFTGERMLIVSGSVAGQRSETVLIFDARLRRRLELEIIADRGYGCSHGQELPSGGLRVLRVWTSADGTDQLGEHAVGAEDIRLKPALNR
jgi:hypothetical protein